MKREEVIRENLADILGVEQHILQSIERQARDDRVRNFKDVHELLQKIETVMRSHIAELGRRISTIDIGAESKLKKAVTLIAGSAAGIYGMLRSSEPISRNLRDDCISLNLAALSYGMLNTASLALDEMEIGAMAERHLTDLTPLIVALSEIIPFVLTRELAVEGQVEDPTIPQQAAALYRQAWSHEMTTGV